jgi:hypothetical protein
MSFEVLLPYYLPLSPYLFLVTPTQYLIGVLSSTSSSHISLLYYFPFLCILFSTKLIPSRLSLSLSLLYIPFLFDTFPSSIIPSGLSIHSLFPLPLSPLCFTFHRMSLSLSHLRMHIHSLPFIMVSSCSPFLCLFYIPFHKIPLSFLLSLFFFSPIFSPSLSQFLTVPLLIFLHPNFITC